MLCNYDLSFYNRKCGPVIFPLHVTVNFCSFIRSLNRPTKLMTGFIKHEIILHQRLQLQQRTCEFGSEHQIKNQTSVELRHFYSFFFVGMKNFTMQQRAMLRPVVFETASGTSVEPAELYNKILVTWSFRCLIIACDMVFMIQLLLYILYFGS